MTTHTPVFVNVIIVIAVTIIQDWYLYRTY